jgi:hypothetical protein
MRLKDLDCPKVALVQDEFYNLDLVVDFLARIGATHVLTCSFEADWPKLYGRLQGSSVTLRTALTGYVDETRRVTAPSTLPSQRPIDLGYRAWNNPYWLGEHGFQKVRIGQVLGEAARQRGLRVDINNPKATDFLVGDSWFEFLGRCRAVLGVEGGASISDHDGAVRRAVERYLTQHPSASFEETRAACFATRDHEINLACISPRHFEACITKTCQVLLEGRYNDVFQPWRHYIPVKRDYSNVDEVLDALEDNTLVDRIATQAYSDIVESGKWSYRSFVRNMEQSIIDPWPVRRPEPELLRTLAYNALLLRHKVLWRFAHGEASAAATALGRVYAAVVSNPSAIWRGLRNPRAALRRLAERSKE